MTPQDLYDYYQYQLAQSANMQYAEEFTKTGNHFDLGNWNLIVDGVTYNGDFTTGGTITLSNSGVVGDYLLTRMVQQFYTSQWNGRQLQRFNFSNVTQSLEIENITVGGSAGSKVTASGYYDETEVSVGDNIRLRITCQAGVNAFLPFETFGLATSVEQLSEQTS